MASNITQILTFKIGNESYAVDIMQVQEVLELTKITKIPQTPDFIKGIINVRGKMLSVVDLKKKLLDEYIAEDASTRCIIIETEVNSENLIIGFLVDSVHEVVEIDESDIELPPKIGASINSKFITGITRFNNDYIIILNIKKIFNNSELSGINDVTPHDSSSHSDDTELIEE